ARQPLSETRHAGAALWTARARLHDVFGSAAVLGLGAGFRGIARISLARHRAADRWTGRLHVRSNAYVDAVGDRVLQQSPWELPRRLVGRPNMRAPGRVRSDAVD